MKYIDLLDFTTNNYKRREKTILKYNLRATISKFTISSKQEPVIPRKYNHDTINFTNKDSDISLIHINVDNISSEIDAYSKFVATFQDCIRSLKISDYSFYSTYIKIECYMNDEKVFEDLNTLLICLFNMTINSLEDSQNRNHFDMYWTGHKEELYISCANEHWRITYEGENNKKSKPHLKLINFKPIMKKGCNPRELKELWFKKLDQVLVMYDFLEIRRDEAKEYIRNEEYMAKFPRSVFNGYIEDIKKAINDYFDIF